MYKHFPIIPTINNNLLSINKSFKTNQILIVGPFITDIDVIDLRINMKLISELNFIERVDFFGKDSESEALIQLPYSAIRMLRILIISKTQDCTIQQD